jgi:hypothetical protein
MTYEPLRPRRINGPHTPRPTVHLWPIGLGMSVQTSHRELHDGLRRALGYGGTIDTPTSSATVNTRQPGSPGPHEYVWLHPG